MAYKFSIGQYRHSGSLVAEEGLTVDAGGLTVAGAVAFDAGVINNAELEHSTFQVNGLSASLGGSVTLDTDDVAEGASNLYWTEARFDASLATKDTDDLAEGSNLYYTDARARAAVSVTDVSGDGSLSYDSATGVITYTGPSATEVRAHLSAGDGLAFADGQFAVTASIAGAGLAWNAGVLSVDTAEIAAGLSGSVEAIVDAHLVGGNGITYSAGDISLDFSEFDSGDIVEGSNLFFTDARARAAVSIVDAGGDGSFTYDSGSGVFTYTGPSAAQVRAHFAAGDTNSIDMTYISGSGQFEAVLRLSGSGLEVTSDGLRIANAAAGAGLGWISGVGALAINTTGAMAIKNDFVAISSSIAAAGLTAIADGLGAVQQLAIAVGGVTNTMLSGGIANNKLINSSVEVVAGDALSGGGLVALGSSITLDVEVNGDALEITGDAVALKSTISGDRTFANNVTISGDLTVNGTTTYINTTDLVVSDALIKIASGSAAFAANQGLELGDYATLKTAAGVADVGNALSSSLPLVAPSMKAATFYGNLEGAMLLGMETKSANATISKNVTRASANITLTLPTAPVVGQEHRIKCVSAADNVVVEAQAGGTIDGAASIVLESPNAAVSLVWDGSTWMVF